ncbi:MAG: energy-coupled thiamine transporter ThiT, partial [Actinomycetota bacterium]|nr:energy-coupled thiamine transporter ThiT [Actinomycetota bacterium]
MRFRTNVLVEMALCIALAAVLNALRIFHMPQGGTVSLVMLPIIVLAVRRGLVVGLVAGAAYGLVDLLIDPAIYYPLQVILDYPIAYGAVGVAGIMHAAWNRATITGRGASAVWTVLLPAVAIATALRYAAHVISGVVFFGQYAPEGQPVLIYSAVYNLYVPISAVGVFAAAAVV